MRPPHEDMPSTESEACDIGGCHEPWAAEVDAANGSRKLRLCCECHDRWTTSERKLEAEREEMRGRELAPEETRPLFGLASALEYWERTGRRSA